MKNKLLQFTIVAISAFMIISCGDDNVITPPIIKENKVLTVADTTCLMFKSINGSKDGGIDGLESGKYRERHLSQMNSMILAFSEMVEISSITFIEETDSVEITGYINCGYSESYPHLFTRVLKANKAKFKYKFEDKALNILAYPLKNEWVTLGYGNKDKIEVFIETKKFDVGAMPIDNNEIRPEIEDRYVWEINGTSGFDASISITPEQATKIIERKNWQDFFDEVNTNWIYIPVGKYYGEMFKSQQDMKHKYQGASWSIYKMTYIYKTTDK